MAEISEFLVGTKIHFTTKDGEFEGTVKIVAYRMKRITFDYVKSLPDHKDLGRLGIFLHEICSFKQLESQNDASDIYGRENADNRVFEKIKMLPESTDCVRHSHKLMANDSDVSQLSSKTIKENTVSECKSRKENLNLKTTVKSDTYLIAEISEFLVGTKIHFTTKDGEFEGTVKSVSYRMKHITFDYVKSLPDHKDLGRLGIFLHEICSFKQLECQNDFSNIYGRETAENTVFEKIKMLPESTDRVRHSHKLMANDSDVSQLSSKTIKENIVSECKSRLENLNLKTTVDRSKKIASQSERKIRYVPAGMDC